MKKERSNKRYLNQNQGILSTCGHVAAEATIEIKFLI